jgi:hypothetical protein
VAETILPTKPVLQKIIDGDIAGARDLWLEEPKAATMLEHGLVRVLRGEVSPLDLTYVGDVAFEIAADRIPKIMTMFGQG